MSTQKIVESSLFKRNPQTERFGTSPSLIRTTGSFNDVDNIMFGSRLVGARNAMNIIILELYYFNLKSYRWSYMYDVRRTMYIQLRLHVRRTCKRICLCEWISMYVCVGMCKYMCMYMRVYGYCYASVYIYIYVCVRAYDTPCVCVLICICVIVYGYMCEWVLI